VLALFLTPCFWTVDLHAQVSPTEKWVGDLVRLDLRDGSSLVGTITSETEDKITIRLQSGSTLTVDKSEIRDIANLNGKIVNGNFLRLDPNRTRLAFAPTGRTLPKGQGYISFNYLFFPLVGYGVTDRFTLAAGMSVFPTIEGQLIYAAPKVQVIRSEKINFSLGVLVIDGIGDVFESVPTLGMTFGSFSYGTEYSSLHLGMGLGFVDGEFGDRPLVLIGGEHQLNNNLKLISENYFVPGFDGALISGGVRFFGKKLATDLLFVTSNDWDGAYPYFGFAYNFGS